MSRHRLRIRFTKMDDLRMIGHRDLLRAWERLFRRAALPLSMTEGFHPKPRVNFPSALAVGIAGLDEVVEVELSEPLSADDVWSRLRPHCPPGLNILSVEAVPEGSPKPHARRVTLDLPVPAERRAALAERIESLLSVESYLVEREQRSTPIDIRPLVDSLELTETGLRMRLWVRNEGSARPREILDALSVGDLEEQGAFLTRSHVELESETEHTVELDLSAATRSV